jgi:hypothetical protein
MRVRDHVALSTATAALLRPRLGRGVVGLWAGSVLIDADHYLWFSVRKRRLNPFAAIRFFNDASPPQRYATRSFHTPVAPLAMLLAGVRRRWLLPVALGIGLHLALDTHHERRMRRARAAALGRDEFSCRMCGARAPNVWAHLWHQPWLLPSYRTENLISLCGACHERAHQHRLGPASWS